MNVTKWLQLQWDRVLSWGFVGLGALVLLVGWLGVSRTPYSAEQLPYILSGGVGGTFLLGLGAMLWLSADLRDEWRKLDRIESVLRGDGAADDARATFNGSRAVPAVTVDAAGDGERPSRRAGRPSLADPAR